MSFLTLVLPALEAESPRRWLSALLSAEPRLLPLLDFGGCGKLAILTERRSSFSCRGSWSFSLSLGVVPDIDRRVVTLGLEP